MLSLPDLRALRLTLRQIADKVEIRFKAWTRPDTSTLIQATVADLTRTKPELIAENCGGYCHHLSSFMPRLP